jgi:diguanylate cyclase (GGDEF)-like protein
MTSKSSESRGFTGAVLDALTSHICILDVSGTIRIVNHAWRRFATENGSASTRSDIGSNYLAVCRVAAGPGSEEAGVFAQGVWDVLQGRSAYFELEYPCHSPTEDRWFVGRVTPLVIRQKGAVVSHMNVTDRKRVELELAKLAATDSLTGLPNRRFFFEVGNREVERVRRFDVPLSVVMIDIDNFKQINDAYGHAAGDEALRQVTASLSPCLRAVDVFARLGGEEFALLLPDTNEAGAEIISEKLRKALASASVQAGPDTFSLTASFGAAVVQSSDRDIVASLERADAALYSAKHSGRDRVVTFSRLQH